MVYLLAISIGLSNTIWGITSEITPSYLLAQMTGVVATFGWLVNFAVNSVFLTILNDPQGKWMLFIVLSVFALLAFLFALFLLPETIGKSTK
jgi:sugar phosphate permease